MAKETPIDSAIDTFVDDLTRLIQSTTAELVEQALSGVRIPPPRARGRKTSKIMVGLPSIRRKGGKRSPEELEELTSSLQGYISKHPGERIEQIGKALGIPTKELVLPVRKLIADKKIVTEGQKRSTTYYVK